MTAKTTPNGVFRGYAGNNNPDGTIVANPTPATAIANIQAYETFIGRQVDYVLDYVVDSPKTWEQFETGVLCLQSTRVGIWSSVLGSRNLLLSIPACCGRSTGSDGGDWQEEATGMNDAHWTALGNYLVDQGLGTSILRIGREFNGNWYPWSPVITRDPPVHYIAGYNHIVSLLKALPETNFTYMWNPMLGQQDIGRNVEDFYPGNNYVDYIGLDVYDWGNYPTLTAPPFYRTLAEQESNFHFMQVMPNGFNAWRAFSRNMSKPLAYPEYGLQIWMSGNSYYGGGDDAFFIRQMENYVSASFMAAMWEDNYSGLFEADDVPARVVKVPESRAQFLASYC